MDSGNDRSSSEVIQVADPNNDLGSITDFQARGTFPNDLGSNTALQVDTTNPNNLNNTTVPEVNTRALSDLDRAGIQNQLIKGSTEFSTMCRGTTKKLILSHLVTYFTG
ncbi:hypothetical protein MKW92_035563, partial [Papaver armeniacum]